MTAEQMTDRELTELAAKVAGIDGHWNSHRSVYVVGEKDWDPLHDAHDSGWLQAKFRVDIRNGTSTVSASRGKTISVEAVDANQDRGAATRRAIVRAVVERTAKERI